MPSPFQIRFQACLIFYQRLSLCILWWSQKSICSCCLFSLHSIKRKDYRWHGKICLWTHTMGSWHTETFMEISRGNIELTRGFKYKPCLWIKREFPIVLWTIYFLVRHRFCKEQQSKILLNSGKFCCIGVLPIFHCCDKLQMLTFIWSFVSSIIPIFQITPLCSFFFYKKGLIKSTDH